MNDLITIFCIISLGYLLGNISVKGLSLGTSGVLLVALVFGHFGAVVPSILRNFGLALFVGSVGLLSGPVFFKSLRAKAKEYVILGILIVVSGALTTLLVGKLMDVRFDLAIGIFTGALTSTPGLAAATEATSAVLAQGGTDAVSLASIGYGIAYPFGVVGIVLFIQLYPRLVHCDIEAECRKLHESLYDEEETVQSDQYIRVDMFGLMILSFVMVLGLKLGSISFPLPGGMSFTLGTAGGPLFVGLLIGHFDHFGKYSLQAPETTIKVLREIGLCLFLLGSGTEAGAGFVETISTQGPKLFLLGIIITLLPMIIACLLARFVFRMDTLITLGSVCGGMTSTPALGALISLSGSEDVAASYASTYPVALILMVLGAQILAMIW